MISWSSCDGSCIFLSIELVLVSFSSGSSCSCMLCFIVLSASGSSVGLAYCGSGLLMLVFLRVCMISLSSWWCMCVGYCLIC